MAHLDPQLQQFLDQWHDESSHILVHTSGSTGTPKPLLVEKARMRASARLTCEFLGLKQGDHALLCLPLDYIAGKMMVVRALEAHLHLHTVPPTSTPLQGQALPPHIHLCAMVPLQVARTLAQPHGRELLARIRHLIIGGGSIPPQLEAQLRTLPGCIWSTYGMTETLSHIALRRVNGADASPWYTPLPGITVTLGPDQCLHIQAPHLCTQVLHTHDRAQLTTHQGHTQFCILGRTDNVIASGGLKIQIEEVEQTLAPHLAMPFLVTKAPHPTLGEQVVLLTQDTHIAHIQEVLCHTLPRHHRPRLVLHTSQIPLTPNGKPARAKAQKIAEEAAKRLPSDSLGTKM